MRTHWGGVGAYGVGCGGIEVSGMGDRRERSQGATPAQKHPFVSRIPVGAGPAGTAKAEACQNLCHNRRATVIGW